MADQVLPSDSSPDGPAPSGVDSALPSVGARVLAALSIVVAGVCGGLIGWKVTDLQVHTDHSIWPGVGGLIGAAIGAGGVAVVAVLVLRAMGEWRTILETGDPAAARLAQKQRRS